MKEQNFFSTTKSVTGAPVAALAKIAETRKNEKIAQKNRLGPRIFSDLELSNIMYPHANTSPELKEISAALRNCARHVSGGDFWENDLFQSGLLYYLEQRKIGYSHSASLLFTFRFQSRQYWREYITSLGQSTVDIIADQDKDFAFDLFPPVQDKAGQELDYSVAFMSILANLKTSQQADIFSLFAVGYSQSDIAEVLNLDKVAVHRAMLAIRQAARLI